jgi:hypothetical protein
LPTKAVIRDSEPKNRIAADDKCETPCFAQSYYWAIMHHMQIISIPTIQREKPMIVVGKFQR